MHLLGFECKNHPDSPLAEPNKTHTSCVHAQRILFVIGEGKERCFASCHERGTKKTLWIPMGNWTSDLRFTRSDALTLSHGDSTVSAVSDYEVLMTRVLHTTRISNFDSIIVPLINNFPQAWKIIDVLASVTLLCSISCNHSYLVLSYPVFRGATVLLNEFLDLSDMRLFLFILEEWEKWNDLSKNFQVILPLTL